MNSRAETVTGLFRNIAARHAERIAVIDGQRALSYRELDALSGNIGSALRQAASPGDPAALLLDHSALAVAALLGAIKAGLPYCFVPPNGTPSEQEAIVRDLQPRVMAADPANLQRAARLAAGVALIELDPIDGIGRALADASPADPSAAVAVYYTSGSTGAPKGVIRTHQAILGRLQTDFEAFRVGPDDNLAQLRPLHVGASSSVLFNALLNGATLHLLEPRTMNGRSLAAALLARRITELTVPTPLLREMLQAIPAALQFPDLRYCRLSGRALTSDLRSLWPHLPRHCIVGHGLASTEAALITHIAFRHGELPRSEILPVGRPLQGVKVWIVDDDDRPVEPGTCGEIVVSSPCVMAGYWGEAQRARRGASPDPSRTGCRVFHTHDTGRMSPEGILEYLGRKDGRVKVRGFTVEVEAVEAALEQLPGVTRAAVRAITDAHDESRLIGYVETKAEAGSAAAGLRRTLAAQVPDYMVPSRLVALRRLPLGPTGKVRVSVLPDPGMSRPDLGHACRPPSTALEERLAGIWSAVLEIEPVGMDDDFFDLGGQSLLAARVAAHIHEQLQVDLPLRLLFEAPTIALLAQRIAALGDHTAQAGDGARTVEDKLRLLGM